MCRAMFSQHVLLEFTDEQQDTSALSNVINIPASGRGISGGGGLALPMEAGTNPLIIMVMVSYQHQRETHPVIHFL